MIFFITSVSSTAIQIIIRHLYPNQHRSSRIYHCSQAYQLLYRACKITILRASRSSGRGAGENLSGAAAFRLLSCQHRPFLNLVSPASVAR